MNSEDLTGKRFGKLVVVRNVELPNSKHEKHWLCKCDCGNETVCLQRALRQKNGTKSCGCLRNRAKDITGNRFGLLVAVKPTDERNHKCIVWEFKCDCGNTCYRTTNQLYRDNPNCGCITKDKFIRNGNKRIVNLLSECVFDTNVKKIRSNKVFKSNTSGVRGVQWAKKAKLWRSSIWFQKKMYNLGYYKDKADAIRVRKQAEDNIFGSFLEWYDKWKLTQKLKKESKNA